MGVGIAHATQGQFGNRVGYGAGEMEGAVGVEGIAAAFEWAVQASEQRRVPVLVEIMCERETNAAMGLSIDKINEYEPRIIPAVRW